MWFTDRGDLPVCGFPSWPSSEENTILHQGYNQLPCKITRYRWFVVWEHLATLDVTFLYTNIPQDEGLSACGASLDARDTLQPPTPDLICLIEFIRMKNNFVFEDEHCLQIQGTAMGTRMAPLYANIFMGILETRNMNDVLHKPSIWWRFIDDIFMVWPHG